MTLRDCLLGVLVVGAVYTDLRLRRIPNRLLLPFLLLGVFVNTWVAGWSGLLDSLAGSGLGLLLLLLPYLAGGIGGGDVKFLATVGALTGPVFIWRAFLAGAIAGGVLSLVQLAFQGRLLQVLKRVGFWLWQVVTPGMEPATLENLESDRKWGKLPYAVPLSIGVLVSRLWL
ncbi:MAG: prepilin peptidase [Firmicutes bacterium]|nr:prepilin peptidase [Bacillota bacterium]